MKRVVMTLAATAVVLIPSATLRQADHHSANFGQHFAARHDGAA